MKRTGTVFAVLILALSVCGAEPLTDGEVWNQGVDQYRSGDVTNALQTLRTLLLSKTHGARAAELVAKLEYERGDLEEAANAAQIALRAAPEDAKANRNFTRATDGLPAQREAKRINAVLAEAQGKDPGALLYAATKEARELMTAAGGLSTNSAARAVALADSLSARSEKLADAWIPVREAIAQSVTNEEQAATIGQQLENARVKTKSAAKAVGDLNPEAYAAFSDAEHEFTRFLKLTVSPPDAVEEGLLSQSNAWLDVEAFNGREWQRDALDYTRAFRAKFPAWARDYEQQAQADTNKPPFTAEAQAKISALATELEKIQLECVEKILPPRQEEAIRILGEIRELLPKDNSGQQGQQQNQQNKNQDQKQNPDPKQDQNPQQQPPEQQPPEQNPDDQDPDENKDGEDGDGGEDEQDEEVEAVLKKAQERSDEHEAEKKARMRKAPLPPNERDW